MLGAMALGLSDLMLAGASRAAGVGPTGAAALVTLSDFPGLNVTELGRHVGLSQPAAARMVDALEAAGLVRRRSRVGRQVAVDLTEAGAHAAHALLAARGGPLREAVAGLESEEREALARMLPKLLTGLYTHLGDAQRMCRLCDRGACMGRTGCPVGAAERRAAL